jgi:biopolymer transport protein ExbB
VGLIDLFKVGGFIMWPLLLCSIAIWFVVIEKFWTLSKFNKDFRRLFERASSLIKEQKIDEAKGLYHQADDLIGRPHQTLFEEMQSSKREEWEEKVSRRLTETNLGLKKFMWVLGTIGNAAPFIGLFGTVVGIIKSFRTIEATGKSGFSVVAGDLSEALVATAAGILVAVVAVMFYNFFQNKIKDTSVEFRNHVEDISDLLIKK